MTNRQPDIEELLCDYIDGTLNAAQKTEVEALLANDARLRQTVQEMMQVRGMLRNLPAEALPAETAHAISREIETPARMSWGMPSGLRLAAALLLSATVALVIWAMLPAPAMRRPMASVSPMAPVARDEKVATEGGDKELAVAPVPPAAAVAPAPTAAAAKAEESLAAGAPPAAVATPAPAAPMAKAASNEAEMKVAVGGAVPGERGGLAPAAAPAPVYAKGGAGPIGGAGGMPGALREQTPEQQALVYAGPPQVMVVKASDIPAVQREIDILLGAGNNRAIYSNASPDLGIAEKTDRSARMSKDAGFGGGMRGPAAMPSEAKQKAPEPMERLDVQVDAATPAQGKAAMKSAVATSPANGPLRPTAQTIVVRNLSPEQLASLRENVLALGNRPNVQVDDQTTLGVAERRVQQQQMRVNQMQRAMPSIQTRDLEDALQANTQNAQTQAQSAQSVPATLDLTIILEPSQLPAAAKPATLPPGVARPR